VRVASRIVGVVLAIAGLVFVGLSALLLFTSWTGAMFGVVLGNGLILTGWYFFRLDVDKPDEEQDWPASRFAPFLLAHRSAFRITALVGLAISLIRLVAVCFGYDWPA
jgi:hypothetical protein